MRSQKQQQQVDSESTAALAVALKHPAVSSDPKNVCSLLQVCRSWRSTVQQSTAGQTSIDFRQHMTYKELPKLMGLSNWFPQHCGLVFRICVEPIFLADTDAEDYGTEALAISLLSLSLQNASMAASQCGPRMALREYVGGSLTSHSLMSALPANSLTTIEVDIAQNPRLCAAAIGRLTNLRQLTLLCSHHSHFRSVGIIERLSSLTQLTQLDLGSTAFPPESSVKLPQQLQRLRVNFGVSESDLYIDLEYLTNLRQLRMGLGRQPVAKAALPAHVCQLSIWTNRLVGSSISALAACDIASLTQLSDLRLEGSKDTAESLQSLAGHPQLRVVQIRDPLNRQVADSVVWQHILRLTTVQIMCHDMRDGLLKAFVQNPVAATGLTRLELNIGVWEDEDLFDDVDIRPVCQLLTSLTSLRHLRTWHNYDDSAPVQGVAAEGTHYLSALTALTSLTVGSGLVVDVTAAIQLALALTNLESLMLTDCRVWVECTAPFPVIGRLTRLRELDVELGGYVSETVRACLSYLTGLSGLTELSGFEDAGDEALNAFWASIRRQQP